MMIITRINMMIMMGMMVMLMMVINDINVDLEGAGFAADDDSVKM